ncbi:uncharacterized protein [Littorina saxatilis]|uniref:uncharacterized protein n=1 Tax=Littorina saxatilis TaxID=31220 RepID=UPI0038B69643
MDSEEVELVVSCHKQNPHTLSLSQNGTDTTESQPHVSAENSNDSDRNLAYEYDSKATAESKGISVNDTSDSIEEQNHKENRTLQKNKTSNDSFNENAKNAPKPDMEAAGEKVTENGYALEGTLAYRANPDTDPEGNENGYALEGTLAYRANPDTDPEGNEKGASDQTKHGLLLHNTEGYDPVQSTKKRVAWQTVDHGEILNVPAGSTDTDNSNPSENCINVDPVVRTDSLSGGVSCPSPVENKRIKDPENNGYTNESDSLTSKERVRKVGFYSANTQRDILEVEKQVSESRLGDLACAGTNFLNGGDKDTDDVQRISSVTNSTQDIPESQKCSKKEYVDINSNQAFLFKQRPVSASGVYGTRSGTFWKDRASSDESLRPSTATASGHKRFSLPLHNSGRDSEQHSKQTLRWDDHKNINTNSVALVKDSVGRDVEKTTREAKLVTYIEKDCLAKDGEKLKDLAEKPPRPSSSRNTDKPRLRPSTASYSRGSTPSASSSSKSGPSSSRSLASSMGPRKAWELGFSKEELQRALPRRNFFNSHNKALKDAGFEVEEGSFRPRRRRLHFFHLDEEEKEEEKHRLVPPVIKEPSGEEDKENGQEKEIISHAHSDNLLDTAMGLMSFQERVKRRKPVVECKPLQLYLTYVRDNPGEYRHMVAKAITTGPTAALHPSSHPADDCHTARLVNMGSIFQARQLSSGMMRSDEVLKAAYSLNPRAADPNRFAKPPRDKSPLLQGHFSRKQSTIPNFQRKESTAPSTISVDDGGSKSGHRSKPGSEVRQRQDAVVVEPLLEAEKRRLKAEEWAQTVTTDQLVRAKLQVLKELGHEERELSQWWLAFKTCYYLRPRIRE